MTDSWAWILVAGILAIADWIVVSPTVRSKRAEYLFKPATMVPLIVATLVLDPERDAQRAWFVAALVLSLAGDVFLMLPSDRFVAGLGSFLLAHIAYIVGFTLEQHSGSATAVGGVFVILGVAAIGRRIMGAARRGDDPAIAGPVTVYMAAISTMLVLAFSTRDPYAIAGAIVFYSSDAMIAWDRFVKPNAWFRPAIMLTYHLAQALLVISLTH